MVKSSSLSEFSAYVLRILVVSEAALLILPIILLVVLSYLTPTYTAPMYHDPIGWLLLGATAVVLAAGGGITFLAVRMLRAGRPQLTIALLLVSTIVFAFPALWLVLLGPAIVIVSKT